MIKTLDQNFRVKKIHILAKDIDSKKKFEIKAKKIFLGQTNSGSCVQNA